MFGNREPKNHVLVLISSSNENVLIDRVLKQGENPFPIGCSYSQNVLIASVLITSSDCTLLYESKDPGHCGKDMRKTKLEKSK